MTTLQPRSGTADSATMALMRRAIELAAHGPERGVNPRVGCVIVDADGAVVAEGWHRGAGTPHAEVDALSKLPPGAARGASAVVTLEPCNHTGRTGPCSRALIDAGVARVIYAVTDPGRASGGGAKTLRSAGVEVHGGVLEDEAAVSFGDWLETARLGRPLVTVKWAQSLDGRAAAADGTSRWITGPAARADVHARRAAADGIGVGTGTLIADDPALTARTANGGLLPAQPTPIVFGHTEVPTDAALRRHPRPYLTLDGDDLAADLCALRQRGIRTLFIEGGPTLASAFIAAGLVDEYLIYLAPALIGGPITALGDLGVSTIDETKRLVVSDLQNLGDDILIRATPAPVKGPL
ncbi:bifunctional diaminohydroxyphosphoribosylaminopyrimidine deaminase/5-amino-6-(5-phosphoribosylamino)uracil reductase RibD [Okibacterium endophyticum]